MPEDVNIPNESRQPKIGELHLISPPLPDQQNILQLKISMNNLGAMQGV